MTPDTNTPETHLPATATGQQAPTTPAPGTEAQAPRYVYGLKGIMQLFGVSNMTAQRYKKGVIKAAVSQYGRKIVTNADLALELFRQAGERKAGAK
ncbi:MAG: DUF3853 family protein [Deltaproteobacteria bacterium]|nr:DUF3853 family protein [Deltaproteobacteria bacterium]